MTRTTRKRLFYVLVLIFFMVSGTVILYAEGWRLNTKNFQAEKVGAIFVRSFPRNATIFLDGEATQNTSGFLSDGTLISNLFPTNYLLVLKAPGYLDWTENVGVSPALVTELKYAVLVPQNATSAASSTVKNFFIAGGTAVTEGPDGTVSVRGKAIGRGDIVAKSADLKNVVLKNIPTGADTLYDLTAQTSTALGTFGNLAIDPYDAATAAAWNGQTIWTIDLGSGTATRIASASASAIGVGGTGAAMNFGPSVAFSQSFIAWSRSNSAATSSEITVYDKFFKSAAGTSSIPGTVARLKWINDGLLGVLMRDGSLYRYDVSVGASQKIADDVKDFYPTNDGTEVAVLGRQSVEIVPISDGEYYRFNLPHGDTIKNLAWYKDKTHLFVEYPDHVSFLDFADAGLHNLATVSEGTSPFYDASTNSLYLIDKGQKLLRFDFPN